MFIGELLVAAALAASPVSVFFEQSDIPGSGLFCYVSSVSYNTDSTMLIEAYSCISDQIFKSSFESPQVVGIIDRGHK